MRLIFMGTPEFAVASLKRLLEDRHEIAAVFTQPDKPAGRGNVLHPPAVKLFAIEHSIPVFQPARIKTNEDVRRYFEQIAPEACIVAAYGKILPAWMLAIPRLGCINVHASLLPKYRGAAPVNWAIANGEHETGVTIMQMDPGMDTGPMLARRAVEIGPEETAPELSSRLAQLGAELLIETLSGIERGEVHALPQDESEATYAPLLKREDGLIDWGLTAAQIANRVRAFQPWPGTHTLRGGHRLIVWRAHAVESAPSKVDVRPGTLLSLDKKGVTLACSGGTALHVEEMQIEGKKRLPAREVANGLRLAIGDRICD